VKNFIVVATCCSAKCYFNQDPPMFERCWTGLKSHATRYTQEDAEIMAKALTEANRKNIATFGFSSGIASDSIKAEVTSCDLWAVAPRFT
jgi:hypothetical protein